MDTTIKRRRGRKRKTSDRPRVLVRGQPEVQRTSIDGNTYVQRYNTCGKPNCHCRRECDGHDPDRPGHGPYWYFERVIKGKTVRRYIGTKLRIGGQRDETNPENG